MRRTRADIREEYLRWLEPQLRDEHGNPSKSYWDLLTIMFDTSFDWDPLIIPMDENRVMDGLDLRVEFGHQHRPHLSTERLTRLGPCSFLEVLIGLSRRMSFIAGGSAPGWAWQLMNNLELHRMTDPLSRHKQARAQEIMHTVIKRAYAPDGTGGFFPLAWADGDQTQIELWYQLHSYVEELHPEH